MADNESIIQDQDGDFSDWIELYNCENYSVNLKNYGLSDNRNNFRKWLLPDIIIPAHAHVLIFASGKNIITEDELHTNFKIAADGEELFLTNSQGILIDETESLMLSANESFGRFPDGSLNWLKTFITTPGESNSIVNNLLFSAEGGYYASPFYLSIQSIMNDSVRYTLNGSEPTPGSPIYSDSIFLGYKYDSANYFSEIPTTPHDSVMGFAAWRSPDVVLHKAHILRCASFSNGVRTSKIYTHTYFVDSTIFDKYSYPVISLVTDEKNLFDYDSGIYVPGKHFEPSDPLWTGNYYQSGSDWERPVHITYFEADGNAGFSQDAGIRIHGFKSRAVAQKSFRLYARKDYGMKHFNYRLLPQRENKEYKRFLLRTTMGDWWNKTLIRDILAHNIARDLNLEYQDYKPAIVYLNGEYWGIYFIRDFIDERYISYLHGYDKDSLDIINGNHGLIDAGTNKHYINLAEYINQNNLENDVNYEYVKTQIDIHNFIDYYIAEMFFANMDWPGNNQKLWRPQTPDGKWRWILFDVDAGCGDVNANMFTHSLSNAHNEWDEMSVSTFLFHNLLKNQTFVDLFLERYAEVLNNEFKTEKLTDKLHQIKELVEVELPDHISRWNIPENLSAWNDDVKNKLLNFLLERSCVVENNVLNFFEIEEFGFMCPKTSAEIENPPGEIVIGPNPNNGNFYILNNSKDIFIDNIIIVDVGGGILWSEKNIHFYRGEKKQFNLNVPAGIYFIQYHSMDRIETLKLIINPQ